MKNNTYCVYIHTNKINNKVYIGQTIYGYNPNLRWRNGLGYEGCTYFYNAIQKYGWDSFEHIVLVNNLTAEEANKAEELLIALYDTRNPKYGYNIMFGGDNHTFAQDTIDKIQEIKRQKSLERRCYHRKEIEQIKRQKRFQKSKEKYEKRYLNDDKKIKKCNKCGCYFIINTNLVKRYSNQILCKECCNVHMKGNRVVQCEDCGVFFEVSSNNKRTHRCGECQQRANKERYRKYNMKRLNK